MSSWLKRHEQWLPQPKKREQLTIPQDNPEEKKSEQYGVTYYPLRCPKCNSKNIKTYASKPPVRYHKCKDCGYKFKSTEKES